MARHADLARERDAVLDGRAARDADLRGEQDVPADRHAVRDLHEIVDLAPGADPRRPDRRSIDRGLCADLDVVFDDDSADLRNLVVGAVGPLREAEPVAADDGAVLDDDAIADPHPLANRDARVEDAVVANLRLPADHDVRIDDGARADSCAFADHRERTDGRTFAELHAFAEHRRVGCAPGAGRQRIREELDRFGEREIRLRVAQHRARRRLGQSDQG